MGLAPISSVQSIAVLRVLCAAEEWRALGVRFHPCMHHDMARCGSRLGPFGRVQEGCCKVLHARSPDSRLLTPELLPRLGCEGAEPREFDRLIHWSAGSSSTEVPCASSDLRTCEMVQQPMALLAATQLGMLLSMVQQAAQTQPV